MNHYLKETLDAVESIDFAFREFNPEYMEKHPNPIAIELSACQTSYHVTFLGETIWTEEDYPEDKGTTEKALWERMWDYMQKLNGISDLVYAMAEAGPMPEASAFKLTPRENLSARSMVIAKSEAASILEALRKTNFNKSKAAILLKIDRKTLYKRLRLYGEYVEINRENNI